MKGYLTVVIHNSQKAFFFFFNSATLILRSVLRFKSYVFPALVEIYIIVLHRRCSREVITQ